MREVRISLGIVVYHNSIAEILTLLKSVEMAEKYLKEQKQETLLDIFFYDNGGDSSLFEALSESSNVNFNSSIVRKSSFSW